MDTSLCNKRSEQKNHPTGQIFGLQMNRLGEMSSVMQNKRLV
jgi:hypothetical protein